MIKFFRRVRQQLLSENKFSKYLIYAIGEIVLVVIGILIALQINNYNENLKLDKERQSLISFLIEDFESTRDNINNDHLPAINEDLEKIGTFNMLIKQETPTVTTDSLRILAVAFFRNNAFEPNLASLDDATYTGKLSLLKNKKFFQKLTEFKDYNEQIQRLSSEKTHSYFNGSLWEIRKTVKPDVLAGNNPMPELNYEEYKNILDKPLAQTAFYNASTFIRNIKTRLDNLLNVSNDIISILKNMQD